jgi:hypothetical protein
VGDARPACWPAFLVHEGMNADDHGKLWKAIKAPLSATAPKIIRIQGNPPVWLSFSIVVPLRDNLKKSSNTI